MNDRLLARVHLADILILLVLAASIFSCRICEVEVPSHLLSHHSKLCVTRNRYEIRCLENGYKLERVPTLEARAEFSFSLNDSDDDLRCDSMRFDAIGCHLDAAPD